MNKLLAGFAAIIFATVGFAGTAHAQAEQTQTQPGVARVSLISGNVSMQRGDSGEWVAVTVNTPLLTGDTISTGPNSRAAVQLDYANVLRLDSNSTAKIANLDRKTIQVQVAQGLVSYDVLFQDEAQAEIDTPNVAVHPTGNGQYRIEVDPNNQTLVTVLNGEADVSTPQGSTRVEQGQLITIQGIDNPEYKISQAGTEDAWDRWNRNRDRQIINSSSWRYTDRYYTGAQELSSYGRWVYASDYGWVWTPYDVGPGWAPYRMGRWVWEPYYGWTWVSYEPWGWAPFHYGRWFLYAGNWSWWPGPVNVYPGYYPVWAPAYVSFFGFGGGVNFSIGFGFGNVGWLPIGPADCYYPWYGYGNRIYAFNFYDFDHYRDYRRYHGWGPLYRRRGGFSNFRMLRTDTRLRGGVSWMKSDRFGRGPVPRQRGAIDGSVFAHARGFSGRLPVMPTKASLRVTNREANPNSYRRGLMGHQRFFTAGHPAGRLTSFHEQRTQLQRSIQSFRKQGGFRTAANGRPLDANPRARTNFGARGKTSVGNSRGFQTGARGSVATSGAASVKTRNGWQRFGGPGRQRAAQGIPTRGRGNVSPARPAHGVGAQRPGWRTFGGASGSRNGNAWMRQGGQANRVRQAPAQRQGGRTFNQFSRQSGQAQRGGGRAPAQRQGWKVFTPNSGQPRNTPPARGRQSAPNGRQGGWQVFRPSSRPPAQRGGGYRGSGRQPLNLRQPIVRRYQAPRNRGGQNFRGGYNGGGQNRYGGAGRAPSYHPPSGNRGGGFPRGGFNRGGSPRGGSPRGGSPRGGFSHGGGFHGGSHGGGPRGGRHGH